MGIMAWQCRVCAHPWVCLCAWSSAHYPWIFWGMALPREAMLKCGVGFSPQDPLSREQSEQDPP